MGIFLTIYNELLFRPLFNGLVFLTGVAPFHDLGMAVIVLTLFVRVALIPLTHRSLKTQAQMRRIEPELRSVREKFKEDKQEQGRQIMELYKKHGVSPFSGCLMLLIQLPILIAMYRVFVIGVVDISPELLYSFVHMPDFIQMKFLNLIDMGKGSVVLAVFAGASQFFQIKLAMPPINRKKTKLSFGEELSQAMTKQSLYIFPILIFFITLRFPSAVALYWTTMNISAILHESLIRKKALKIHDKPTGTSTKHASGAP